jgi:RNA polymerase sigma-70 factor (ECF subfamily)
VVAPVVAEPEAPPTRGGVEPPTARLDRALEDLPDDQRVAFLLVEVHGLSLADVAAIEDVPLGTVKSRLSRALDKLRASLAFAVEP